MLRHGRSETARIPRLARVRVRRTCGGSEEEADADVDRCPS
jgi:hypothetical protein